MKETRRRMAITGIDVLLAFSSYPEREGHLQYLTNYHGAFPQSQHDEIYEGLGHSALALTQGEGPILFPGLLFAAGRLVGVEKVQQSEKLPIAVSDFVTSRKKVNTIGLAGADIFPHSYLEELKGNLGRKSGANSLSFVDAGELLLEQRMAKSEAERRVLRFGAKIADAGIQAAFEATKVGSKESDLGLAAARACYEMGADYVARTRIYGHNISGVRWPIMTNRKLRKGEITGIDLVGFYQGYGFDVLRLWTVGRPAAKQQKLLADAATLTESTIEKIQVGMTGDDVCNLTLKIAKELQLQGTPSPFGHAIGLEIVENPLLLPHSRQARIVKGATLCIEPSLENAKGESVHFEDEIAVGTENSPEVFSACPKEFY